MQFKAKIMQILVRLKAEVWIVVMFELSRECIISLYNLFQSFSATSALAPATESQ